MTEVIFHGEGKRFQFVIRPESHVEAIVDSKNGINLFFLPSGGFGPPSSTTEIAKSVVDFLNERFTEAKLYPEK